MKPYNWNIIVIVPLIVVLLPQVTYQSRDARRLIRRIMKDYEVLERPVLNESDPVVVNFGITLQQIIDVDEKNQIISTNVWLDVAWMDQNLHWDPTDYGNITTLRIPPDKIWRPDVLMYNSADERFDGTYHSNVVLSHDGACSYIPPGIFRSTCKINIAWYPFDEQRCLMKFGSWTYDGTGLDLRLSMPDGGDISDYIENGEWDLIGVPGQRNKFKYTCCPEPYYDITFTVVIRRRVLYYLFNLLIPCFLISTMTLLVFLLPPDSGEKLTLCVTILLSLMVFLLLVAETMPATSDAVPLIGKYFACIMIMCALSVTLTVCVLNMHHRTTDLYQMPNWMRTVFLYWLPKMLCMKRKVNNEDRLKQFAVNSKLKEIELKERCSRSLLANVLDADDDFRSSNNTPPPGGYSKLPLGENRSVLSGNRSELADILHELKVITSHFKEEEEERELNNDWKFAAMVVDRICLIVFSVYTVVAICSIIFSAPGLIL